MLTLCLILFMLIFIPGYTLMRVLRAPASPIMAIPCAFFTGYALWALLTPFAFLLHLAWPVVMGAHLLIAAALWGIFLAGKYYRITFKFDKSDRIFWLFVIGMMIVAAWKGGYQDGDAWYHIAQANYYLKSGVLQSGNAYYQNQPAGTVYDFNSYHLFLAYMTRLTGLDLSVIWIHLLPIVLLLFLLAFYGILRAFRTTRLTPYIFVFVIILAFLLDNEGILILETMIYPGWVGLMVLLPVILYALMHRIDARMRPKAAVHLALLVFTLSSLHLFAYVFFMINFSLVLAVLFMRSRKMTARKAQWRTYSVLFGVCVASGLFYAGSAYTIAQSGSPAESFPGTPLRILSYGAHLYAFPLRQLYPLTMATLVIALVYLCLRPSFFRETRLLFFLIPLFFQPLLLYNPVLVPVFSKLLHVNLVGRFKTIIWTLVPLPLFMTDVMGREPLRSLSIRGRHWIHTHRRAATPAGVLVFLAVATGTGYMQRGRLSALRERISEYDRFSGPLFQTDFFRRIDEVVPARRVIVSDPYTSYHIPAFADQFIYAANVHSIPASLDFRARFQTYLRIFSPFSSLSMKRASLRRDGIGYLAVNETITPLTRLRDPLIRRPPLLTGWAYPDWDGDARNIRLYDVRNLPDEPVQRPASHALIFADSLRTPQGTIYTYPAAGRHAGRHEESLHFPHAGYIILWIEISGRPPPRLFSFTFSSSYGFHQVMQIASYARTGAGWREIRVRSYINEVQAGGRTVYTTPVRGKTLGVFISGSPFLDLNLSHFRFHDDPSPE